MRVLFTIIMLLLSIHSEMAGQEHTVMFYNVENLFDTSDDTTTNDEEFLPEGSRKWISSRYHNKLNSIARAVAFAGGWDLPSLIGLCEVENERVLKDLAYGTLLSAQNYGIVHRDSPDPRGIDIALLYRRDLFTVADARSWLPESEEGVPVLTRNLLYVKVSAEHDVLHLILCHLPSRRGGVLAAEALRERMLKLAACKADSIMRAECGKAAVIVMGDFNMTPVDVLMSEFARNTGFINLSAEPARDGQGSYKYQGAWEMIDQVLVSPALTDSSCVWQVLPGSFRVADAPFLLMNDEIYPGQRPFPAYGGYRYSGGYSDHLPVIVRLSN